MYPEMPSISRSSSIWATLRPLNSSDSELVCSVSVEGKLTMTHCWPDYDYFPAGLLEYSSCDFQLLHHYRVWHWVIIPGKAFWRFIDSSLRSLHSFIPISTDTLQTRRYLDTVGFLSEFGTRGGETAIRSSVVVYSSLNKHRTWQCQFKGGGATVSRGGVNAPPAPLLKKPCLEIDDISRYVTCAQL